MTKNNFEVLRAGINTTYQDLGRNNLNYIGIPFSGAMDSRNYLISNQLVGNDKHAPTIEFAYQGPLIKFGEVLFLLSNISKGVFPIMFHPPGLSKV